MYLVNEMGSQCIDMNNIHTETSLKHTTLDKPSLKHTTLDKPSLKHAVFSDDNIVHHYDYGEHTFDINEEIDIQLGYIFRTAEDAYSRSYELLYVLRNYIIPIEELELLCYNVTWTLGVVLCYDRNGNMRDRLVKVYNILPLDEKLDIHRIFKLELNQLLRDKDYGWVELSVEHVTSIITVIELFQSLMPDEMLCALKAVLLKHIFVSYNESSTDSSNG